jgi:hypothetical protein
VSWPDDDPILGLQLAAGYTDLVVIVYAYRYCVSYTNRNVSYKVYLSKISIFMIQTVV